MFIVTAVHLVRPMILRLIIDRAIPAQDLSLAFQYAAIFLGSLAIGAGAMFVRIKIMARMGAEIIAGIKKQVFEQILKQGMRFFDHNQTGKLIARTESDANQLKTLFTQSSAQLFASGMLIIGTIGVLAYEDLKIGIAAASTMLVLTVLMSFYLKYVRNIHTQAREKNSQLTGYLAEYIQGTGLIKVHGREKEICKNLHFYNKEKADLECKAAFIEYTIFSSSFRFATEIGSILLLFFYCSTQVYEGTMTVGSLIMYIELLRQFFRPLEFLVEILAQIQAALAAGSRVFDIIDTEPDVIDNHIDDCEVIFNNRIEFCNLSFAYNNEPVLKNVSFPIIKGQQTALAGASGSGKTTCINLLLRFYDPCKGSIKIDGKDIKEIGITKWRENIALVLQEIYLFPGTVMENLKAFHQGVSRETVIDAAKKIGSHKFIMSLPDGYDTVLAERGANLSYGERQLLSYTRALVKNPEILILDEATSSVDLITENKLQKAMKKLMTGRTSIIIAHRLSTIKDADCILIFENGEIVQRGKHSQLLEVEGIYKSLVNIQSGKTKFDACKTNSTVEAMA